MILVFGGTTEGKQVAKVLDELYIPYYYSTKTKVEYAGKGTPICGEMTPTRLTQFCIDHHITHIINASHPFAVHLHQTVASIPLELPILRFQRAFSPRIVHKLVSYVATFEEAITHFQQHHYQSLLALSGVQTIVKLKSYWQHHKTWFRILDRDISRAIAAEAQFPKTQLLYGYPQTKAAEIELFTQIAPDVIFTKESGTNGKLDEKIHAALALQTPIVILKKPKLSNRYLCINSTTALINYLKSNNSLE